MEGSIQFLDVTLNARTWQFPIFYSNALQNARRKYALLDQKKFDAAFDFSFCEISLDLAKCNKKSDLLGKFCVLN